MRQRVAVSVRASICATLSANPAKGRITVAQTQQSPQSTQKPKRSRAKVVKPGRLPVSEFAFDRAGAGSPFGDDITFPLPVENLTYRHPSERP